MSQKAKTKIYLKKAQEALGAIQKALTSLNAAYSKITSLKSLDHNFLASESEFDYLFSDLAKRLTDEQKQTIREHANEAAMLLLCNEEKTFSKNLQAVFSEAIRNLSDYKIFSRKNRTVNEVTNALQNALMVREGMGAVRENLSSIFIQHGIILPEELMKAFHELEHAADQQIPKIVTALNIESAEFTARKTLALKDLEKSSNLSYIAPLPSVF